MKEKKRSTGKVSVELFVDLFRLLTLTGPRGLSSCIFDDNIIEVAAATSNIRKILLQQAVNCDKLNCAKKQSKI